MKKVLVAVDLSPLSLTALDRAFEFAKENQAELTLLHVHEKGGGFFDLLPKKALPPARQYLIKFKEHIHNVLAQKIKKIQKAGVRVNIKIMTGKTPSKVILNFVKNHSIDLLYMGAHSQYTFYNWFVGTTAEHIAEKVSCPVFIIKRLGKVTYKNILLPVDFSKASEASVDFAESIFPESRFYAIYVGDEAYNQLLKKDQLKSYVKAHKIKNEIIQLLKAKLKDFMQQKQLKPKNAMVSILLGYPGIEILKEAKKKSYQLIVMGTQGHHKRHYAWLGRVANRVLVEIDKDLLLVPPRKIKKPIKVIEDSSYVKKITEATNEYLDDLKELAFK